ncbi:MAG: cryptochrome/photolyase family protein [Pseudomonadota bacterium]
MPTLHVVLGDQLSHSLPLFDAVGTSDRVLLMEVAAEATHVPHHPKKLVLVFSAMRHFAAELEGRGFNVDYIELDTPASRGSFSDTLAGYLAASDADAIRVTHPSEYRVLTEIEGWSDAFGLPVDILPDPRFVVSPGEFATWAEGRKQLVMEQFYRKVRQQTGLLIDDGKPTGGKWNYDKDNRKPPRGKLDFPAPFHVAPDPVTKTCIGLVRERFANHFGDIDPFWFAVTAADAERAAEHFFEHALALFGDYQDAMLNDESFLYHSVLSQYLNLGLLDPLALCREAERRYRAGQAPLNAVEGFIRQIIGWREFVRGVYWLQMPEYSERNFLRASTPLPAAYWGGETDMACVAGAVRQTREHAYSHHIQRLMVTGNLALLLGVAPEEIHRWYLAVYADAYEWVEMPNTLGMATFADGGVIGTKPYAASGSYINKMSDYCSGCRYDVKQREGDSACPFNYLYWDFLIRHEERLGSNRRMSLIYAQLRKMDDTRRKGIERDARRFRRTLEASSG